MDTPRVPTYSCVRQRIQSDRCPVSGCRSLWMRARRLRTSWTRRGGALARQLSFMYFHAVQIMSPRWLVGIDPDGALRLRGALDDAEASLDACASRVQRLLDEAGVACRAPMDIRGAARTCGGVAHDLSRRLAVIQASVPAPRPGAGVSLPGPGIRLGGTAGGCGVAPAPVLVTSCYPPQPHVGVFGRPPVPLGLGESLPPAGPSGAGLLGTGHLNPSRPSAGKKEQEEEEPPDEEEAAPFRTPRPGTGQQRASDVPSWVKNDPEGRPRVGENGGQFAKRLLDRKYGEGNWPQGPGTEHNRIQKYGDRGFQ